MRWFVKALGMVLVAPFRLISGIRESMTGASATLLVVGILSVNIVWGYPWLGMFAATVAMFIVGFVLNRVFRPRLRISMGLPVYAVVGKEFLSTVHLQHRGPLPAFDLHVHAVPSLTPKAKKTSAPVEIVQSAEPVWMIDGRGSENTAMLLRGNRRGIHRLPAVETVSMFPFSLFRSIKQYKLGEEVAIAPRPFSEGENEGAEQMLSEVNQWTERWFAGENLDYIGSREYVVGMPVRRWDFRSWARLGRPIVREFQTPTVRIANLFVDTALDDSVDPRRAKAAVELMLRYVATTIDQYHRKSIEARMHITSEVLAPDRDDDESSLETRDALPVRLARAREVTPGDADRSIGEACDKFGDQPTLMFTTRRIDRSRFGDPRQLLVVRVDPSEHAVAARSDGQRRAQRSAQPIAQTVARGAAS